MRRRGPELLWSSNFRIRKRFLIAMLYCNTIKTMWKMSLNLIFYRWEVCGVLLNNYEKSSIMIYLWVCMYIYIYMFSYIYKLIKLMLLSIWQNVSCNKSNKVIKGILKRTICYIGQFLVIISN